MGCVQVAGRVSALESAGHALALDRGRAPGNVGGLDTPGLELVRAVRQGGPSHGPEKGLALGNLFTQVMARMGMGNAGSGGH